MKSVCNNNVAIISDALVISSGGARRRSQLATIIAPVWPGWSTKWFHRVSWPYPITGEHEKVHLSYRNAQNRWYRRQFSGGIDGLMTRKKSRLSALFELSFSLQRLLTRARADPLHARPPQHPT
jgi:hypothetical protein